MFSPRSGEGSQCLGKCHRASSIRFFVPSSCERTFGPPAPNVGVSARHVQGAGNRVGNQPDGRLGRTVVALFTETPHDMTARTGEDVEMACSFRGSGSPSYSLEIQWWYVRSHRDWTDKQAWASNQLKASQQEDAGKDATKISVVKVVGSNISHKLRLSRVKPTDEGTYECRVIDFSDGKARHHKVKAYLRVQPGENSVLHLPEAPPAAPAPPPPKPGKELRKRSVDEEACSL
ncbi:PREDICTED: V-set and transmembrane domain-containing protein 2-like protein [Myotis brandtii]|uniref:V-set and transmembrane domain-containing protein 2-like protein n=1 Tax=Myotis brandtii TaxID=109478 RepID=UPI000703CC7F|nr:PREDICTED: V-set and transmembrane domain-containing protein 2-like protein [Myotis brandtii]